MKSFWFCALSALGVVSCAVSNITVSSCSYAATCSAGGYAGVCVDVDNGCCSGTVTSGLCPGAANIKCCTQNACSLNSGESGICISTKECKNGGGRSYSGYCVGPTDIQCCTNFSPTPTNPDNAYYFNNWCANGSLQYLDDANCEKAFPSVFDRDWTCPVPSVVDIDALVASGYAPDQSLATVKVDTEQLANIVTNGANLCVILTKRVATDAGTQLYNKYLCAGEYSRDTIYETWSSSKIFAIANAAGHLRSNETSCATDTFGLQSSTSGKHGSTSLGDLATVVCSYDHTAGYSSNSLSSYFHDLGWRERLNSLVGGDWLGLPQQKMTLGGNYGEATPSDLGFTLTSPNAEQACSVDKDPWPTVHDNSLSALGAAELTRRIALHRELKEELRWPGATWEDFQNELYGAEKSALFPGERWGGMTVDISVFLQSGLDMEAVEAAAQGKWRIFSKLGAGYSNSRYVGEIVNNAYACLPDLDANGVGVGGLEFTMHARGSIPHDSSLTAAEAQVAEAVQATVKAIVAGVLK